MQRFFIPVVAALCAACGSAETSVEGDAAAVADTTTADTAVDPGPETSDATADLPDNNADDAMAADATEADVAPPPKCPGAPGPGTLPNGTKPGALTFPHPTINNGSVLWLVEGDADNDAVVTIRFRKKGSSVWRAGLPLRRIPAGSNAGHTWANSHAGSLFNLEADTTYEVEAFLLDPDGGCELKTGALSTRPVPGPMPGAPVKKATPSTFNSVVAAAVAGDIVELGEGTYPGFTFAKDGAPGKPIVIRGAGAVNIEGNIELNGRKYVHLAGVRVRGRVRLNNTVGMAIVGNTVTNTADDAIAARLRTENSYIADNIVSGGATWAPSALGVDGFNNGEGITVTGPGNVVEHNRVTGFRDCLSLMEGTEADDQWSVDFIENDLYSCTDDAVEADFCFHNCRVVRNRATNTFIGLSSQPAVGGPAYFVRNAMYNVILAAFKLQRSSVNDVVLHNTVVKNGDALGIFTTDIFDRQYFRNNLMIGGPGGTYGGYSNGSGRVISLDSAGPNGSYNYDGFGSTNGKFEGRIGSVSFTNLAELRSKTTEKQAVQLGLDVFATAVAYPTSPFPAREPASFVLKTGSAAEDVGLVLPNINDAFAGKAPDLGAHESGAAVPKYGPR